MEKKYFEVSARFKGEAYKFLVTHAHYLKMTRKDVHKIITDKYRKTIPEFSIEESEIAYIEQEISETTYILTDLDKYDLDMPVIRI